MHFGSIVVPITMPPPSIPTRYQHNKGRGSQDLRSAAAGISGEHRRLPDAVQTRVQERDTREPHAATAVRGQPCLKIGREEVW